MSSGSSSQAQQDQDDDGWLWSFGYGSNMDVTALQTRKKVEVRGQLVHSLVVVTKRFFT